MLETTVYITEKESTGVRNNSICLSIYNSNNNDQCLELCPYEEFIENNCGINSSNKNTIIYNLIKNYIQNYKGEDNLILETDDNQVFQLTTSSNEKNTKDGKSSNNFNLSMIDLGDCEETLKRENNINSNVSLIIYKLEKVG